ncbi:MAG TPA: hypothetical protein VL400_11630, partial [Polyangiaceae bacterium]|nr:hypothetical protein [Polyangiaceae bacterium]
MVAILSTIREIDRLRQIAVVLARHGFTDIVKRMGLLRVGKKRAAGEAQPAESANGEGDGLAQDIDIDLGELEKVAAPEVAKSS